jgi:predicted GH43/DUF377 family glycosyl hydrolase
MIKVEKLGIILKKTKNEFECEGVLNPAVIEVGGYIHLFYRAVSKGNFSTIGYCRLSSPMVIESRFNRPLLVPEANFESQGLEDPRIVEIDGVFYLSYTAYDGINALGAVAISTDLLHWTKLGIVVPQITYEDFIQLAESNGSVHEKYVRYNEYKKNHESPDKMQFVWDKNLVFFPRRIQGKLYFLHRIKPDIQIVVAVDKLEELTKAFWLKYLLRFDECILLTPKFNHESSYVGSGCPPIETSLGWLLIYHGVRDTINGYVYSACAALLDLKRPEREIARLPYPLFFPDQEWELIGEVNNVCFPTGAIVEGENLFVYYGAADKRIAVAQMNLNELLTELALFKNK